MSPVEAFGSGACAVTLVFFATIWMMRAINHFIDKYPPLHYAGDGSLLLLILYMSRGIAFGIFTGAMALWVAACLAVEFGAVA